MGEALLEITINANPQRDCSVRGSARSRCSVTSKEKERGEK